MPIVQNETELAEARGRDLPHSVRVDARLKLVIERTRDRLRLAERHESGVFRFRMPRREPEAIEAMLVNVAGGLAGGDRVRIEAEAREGAALVLSSATGERIYRSGGDETCFSIALRAEPGSTFVWLPHETILHEGARLDRRLDISVAPDARFLFGEMIQLGRVASGERFRHGMMRDGWRVRVGGKLVFAEATQLGEGMPEAHSRSGGLGNAAFLASLLLIAPEACERLAAIRAALRSQKDVRAAATCHSGLVFARLISEDDIALRRGFLEVIRAASGGSMPLPRVLLSGQ